MTIPANQGSFLPPERIVRRIIQRILIDPGFFCQGESDELYQEITLDLLVRKNALIQSFRGLSKFQTYMYTVICRKCIEIRRRKNREKSRGQVPRADEKDIFGNLSRDMADQEMTEEEKMMVLDTCRRLGHILDTYGSKKTKLVFSLRALYRIIVYLVDLKYYSLNDDHAGLITSWIEVINDLEKTSKDQEVYHLLTRIFNVIENKHNTNDAIRKWTEERMEQIVYLLNTPPAGGLFNRETMQILFEYCHTYKFLS